MMENRPSAGSSDDEAGRQALPPAKISPLSVDTAFLSSSSSSTTRAAQSADTIQQVYSAASPGPLPLQEEHSYGQPATTLPYERPLSAASPPPNQPASAYLSHQSPTSAEPQGYTPLNDMSASARAALKGKGRARNQGWVDLERGGGAGSLDDDDDDDAHDMVKDGWDRVDGDTENVRSPTSDLAEYPPPLAMTEEKREEKRIADVRGLSPVCRPEAFPRPFVGRC